MRKSWDMNKFHLHSWALELQAIFYLSLKKHSNCLQLAILAEKNILLSFELEIFYFIGMNK